MTLSNILVTQIAPRAIRNFSRPIAASVSLSSPPIPTLPNSDWILWLDTAVRDGFQSERYWLFICLLVSTAIVALGCVLELEKFKAATHRPDVMTGMMRPRRFALTLKAFNHFGLMLVVFGILAEGVFEGLVTAADSWLQTFNDIRLVATQQESEAAADSAARAKREADQVTGIATAARSTADNARAGATAAERQVDSVRSEAASLRTELDAEKEDLRQIRAARYIPDTANFISAMRPLAGTKYLFWTVAQDADSLRIAILLNSLLKTSGWIKLPLPQQKEHDPLAMNIFQVSNPAEYIPPERFSAGIRIFISSPVVAEGEQRSLASLWKVWGDNPPSSAKPAEALARELTDKLLPHEKTDWGGVSDEEKALGYRPFQVMVVSGNENDADVIAISVGAKPL
jgi:hypothetical protein